MQPLTSSACALDGCAAKVVELSTVDRGVRTLGLVLGLIGLPVVVVGALYWLTSEPYWIYHERIYDSVRNEYRCVDPDTGELSAIPSPCLVLTRRGRDAVEHQTAECVKRGGAKDACKVTAWDWVNAQKTKPR